MYNTLGPDPGMVGSTTAGPTQQQQQPAWLQQQAVTSPTAGVANMIKALISGDQSYRQRQGMQNAPQTAPGVVGSQPLNIVPPSAQALNLPNAPSYVPTWQQSWDPSSSSGGLW